MFEIGLMMLGLEVFGFGVGANASVQCLRSALVRVVCLGQFFEWIHGAPLELESLRRAELLVEAPASVLGVGCGWERVAITSWIMIS